MAAASTGCKTMKTLNDILKEHPEWGDIPVGIYMPDGHYDMIDEAGDVYVDMRDDDGVEYDDGRPTSVLVFAGN